MTTEYSDEIQKCMDEQVNLWISLAAKLDRLIQADEYTICLNCGELRKVDEDSNQCCS